MRKIVAIGGGENGRPKRDGTNHLYELESQDKEIVSLTGKNNPNFLLLAHAQPLENQQLYFDVMKKIYGNIFGCNCKDLKSNELSDFEYMKEIVEWADIIYEGGGNTLDMIKLWQDTRLDKLLRKAWQNGTVMCGVSAGANCWFNMCSSDSLKIKYGEDQPLIGMKCLNFVDGMFVPHADEKGRKESVKMLLKDNKKVGLLMSNCTALEIVDNKYRLITSDASFHGIEAFGIKAYWKDGKYFEEQIDKSLKYKELAELLKK